MIHNKKESTPVDSEKQISSMVFQQIRCWKATEKETLGGDSHVLIYLEFLCLSLLSVFGPILHFMVEICQLCACNAHIYNTWNMMVIKLNLNEWFIAIRTSDLRNIVDFLKWIYCWEKIQSNSSYFDKQQQKNDWIKQVRLAYQKRMKVSSHCCAVRLILCRLKCRKKCDIGGDVWF